MSEFEEIDAWVSLRREEAIRLGDETHMYFFL